MATCRVQPLGVVVLLILAEQVIEALLAEDREVIEVFSFDRLYLSLGMPVKNWGVWREPKHGVGVTLKHTAALSRELGVAEDAGIAEASLASNPDDHYLDVSTSQKATTPVGRLHS
ncbi:MAG: hypothetical protein AAGC91_11920 [Pseudomonadota bacterium]